MIDRIKVKSILLNALNRQFKRVLYVEKLGYGYKLDIIIMFRVTLFAVCREIVRVLLDNPDEYVE